MAEILDKLRVKPKVVGSNTLLYSSPLHQDKRALLEIDLKTNCWYDRGQKAGGQSVDFVCAYLKYTDEAHTEADALRWLKNMVLAPAKTASVCTNRNDETKASSTLILKTKKPIHHLGLIRYLEKSSIPLAIAQRFLKEVRVYNTQTKKSLIALVLPNEAGGFELTNPFFRGYIGSQAITFIRGQMPKPETIHLFNDVMDYLAAITQLNGQGFKGDTIILNSLSCLEQISPYLQNYGYRTAYSWMENDEAGEKATAALSAFFKTQDKLSHKRMNTLYAPHKNVSAWHKHQQELIR